MAENSARVRLITRTGSMRTYLGPGSMAHRFRKEDAMSIFTIYHDSMMTTSIGRGPFLDRTNNG